MSTEQNQDMIDQDLQYRTKLEQAAKESPNAQAWLSKDEKATKLESRIMEYDAAIGRRQDGTQLIQLRDVQETAMNVHAQFLADNPRPSAFQPHQRAEWLKQFETHTNNLDKANEAVSAWNSPEKKKELAELQKRREQKFEQYMETIKERQTYGLLPSERPLIMETAMAESEKMGMNNPDAFDIMKNLRERRGNKDEATEQQHYGNRVGNLAWSASTPTEHANDPEMKALEKTQNNLVRELGRWPTIKEIEASEAKQREEALKPKAETETFRLQKAKTHTQS